MIKDQVKQTVAGCIVEAPLQGAYQFVFNRLFWKYRVALRSFYAQFISPGDLVFDIGANVGSYTEMFLRLGAKVVAAEPNRECALRV